MFRRKNPACEAGPKHSRFEDEREPVVAIDAHQWLLEHQPTEDEETYKTPEPRIKAEPRKVAQPVLHAGMWDRVA
jgi:hypothetical protein